ncbi:hypothetical protein FG379_002478 [Cryptosporidium bovis]|uniref:uncharacterized protein n=1 Tax=Cryptosporidium bovis TaxID=310047 RepID=UPI00351A7E9A|nr:hypothetical protein FG379_002478 [Cryptosporidium bovis]
MGEIFFKYGLDEFDCIGYCDFENFDTPVGLLYDEFEDIVLVACNDSVFCFNICELTSDPGRFICKGEEKKLTSVNNNKINFGKSVKFGGNIRNIKKSRCGGMEANTDNKDKSESACMENYVLVNRKNYPIIVTDFGLRTISTIHVKNNKDELENIFSVDFVVDANKSESTMLFGCKNRIYLSDFRNPKQVSCINLKQKTLDGKNNIKHQKGIVSSLSVKTKGIGCFSVFSSGTFSGSIFLHDLKNSDTQIKIFDSEIKMNGITELYWLEDPHYHEGIEYHLISGDRRNEKFYIWDVRKPNKVLCKIERENGEIDQRFIMCFNINKDSISNEFKLDIFSGDSNGNLNNFKLDFEYEEKKLKNETISLRKYSIDNKSIPFIDINKSKNILLTLSANVHLNYGI